MERVSIGKDEHDSEICRGGCRTSIDSGCSYLISSLDEVALLHKKLGGIYAPNITNCVSACRNMYSVHPYTDVLYLYRCSTSSLAPRENLFLRLFSKLVAKIIHYQEWSTCKK